MSRRSRPPGRDRRRTSTPRSGQRRLDRPHANPTYSQRSHGRIKPRPAIIFLTPTVVPTAGAHQPHQTTNRHSRPTPAPPRNRASDLCLWPTHPGLTVSRRSRPPGRDRRRTSTPRSGKRRLDPPTRQPDVRAPNPTAAINHDLTRTMFWFTPRCLGAKNAKRPVAIATRRLVFRVPAASYSPTRVTLQYHRRRKA